MALIPKEDRRSITISPVDPEDNHWAIEYRSGESVVEGGSATYAEVVKAVLLFVEQIMGDNL